MNNSSNSVLERQQLELSQSLKYASYIQKALLPDDNILDRYFPERILMYVPRDIVSGDFYWISKKNNLTYIAIADCTGHGVPGAFLSILGISFLNQIIDRHEYKNAGMVLNQLREYMMKSMQQTGRESEQKDGIDMAFCIINSENDTLQYAGAFNPIYVSGSDGIIHEIAGDKMPIGVAAEEEKSFTNHVITLKKGEMIYLFSDGFADQFGGPKGKKFKYRPFRELLQFISSKNPDEQLNILTQTFNDWKGNLPQLDDVLIFGFRYQ